jgi:hypothetical protein
MAVVVNWSAVSAAIPVAAAMIMAGSMAYTANSKADDAKAAVIELRKNAYKEVEAIKQENHKQDKEILTIKLSVEHIKEGVDKLVEKLLKE